MASLIANGAYVNSFLMTNLAVMVFRSLWKRPSIKTAKDAETERDKYLVVTVKSTN